jgi:hypothetical protein
MDQELIALCEQKFAAHVDTLFKQMQARERTNATQAVPLLDLSYPARDQALVPLLKQIVVAALVWQERFRQSKPDWYAAELPITGNDCMKAMASGSRRMRQLGQFAHSLMLSRWNPAHPEFADFCRAGEDVWNNDETMEGWEALWERMNPERFELPL